MLFVCASNMSELAVASNHTGGGDGLLCGIANAYAGDSVLSFFYSWLAITTIALVSLMGMSGTIFYHYYVKVTYDKWVNKSNPRFPKPEKVKEEIMQMLKGLFTATLAPTLSLWLSANGKTKAFCGWHDYEGTYYSLPLQIGMFFGVWAASDFCEFFYHYLGHRYNFLWMQHKYHHRFANPTPFAVIADDYVDQFIRACPLLVFPLLVPINMDVMFFQWALFFYGYGVYLHWGYEFPWIHSTHPILNTSYQHYLHHQKSVNGIEKTYHCGFMFKIWDQLFGTVWPNENHCADWARKNGERTEAQFKALNLPDYSVLLSPSFWLNGPTVGAYDKNR